ncbi:MAG: hypothetical protein HC773_23265 [Scytonema sp. CRU_2_7]|nr:hypothetical protein [Scytonema sp. CRU_2_7]
MGGELLHWGVSNLGNVAGAFLNSYKGMWLSPLVVDCLYCTERVSRRLLKTAKNYRLAKINYHEYDLC